MKCNITALMPRKVWSYSIPGDSTWIEFFPNEKDLDKKIVLMKKELNRALSLDYRERVVKLPNGGWDRKQIDNDDLVEDWPEIKTRQDALFYALYELYNWIHALRVQIEYYEDESIAKKERIKNFPGGELEGGIGIFYALKKDTGDIVDTQGNVLDNWSQETEDTEPFPPPF